MTEALFWVGIVAASIPLAARLHALRHLEKRREGVESSVRGSAFR